MVINEPSRSGSSSWRHSRAPRIDLRSVRGQHRTRFATIRPSGDGIRPNWTRLASDPEVGKLPFRSLRLLAFDVFWGKGPRGKERAVALLEGAQLRDPGNFWLNSGLSNWLGSGTGRLQRPDDRLRYAHIGRGPDRTR